MHDIAKNTAVRAAHDAATTGPEFDPDAFLRTLVEHGWQVAPREVDEKYHWLDELTSANADGGHG